MCQKSLLMSEEAMKSISGIPDDVKSEKFKIEGPKTRIDKDKDKIKDFIDIHNWTASETTNAKMT